MTAMNATCYTQSSNCSTAAAAYSSAPIIDRMDTAINLVVSIIVRLISIRLRICVLA